MDTATERVTIHRGPAHDLTRDDTRPQFTTMRLRALVRMCVDLHAGDGLSRVLTFYRSDGHIAQCIVDGATDWPMWHAVVDGTDPELGTFPAGPRPAAPNTADDEQITSDEDSAADTYSDGSVRQPADHCPVCGRYVSDLDDDGREGWNGQRWHAACVAQMEPDTVSLVVANRASELEMARAADVSALLGIAQRCRDDYEAFSVAAVVAQQARVLEAWYVGRLDRREGGS